MQAKWREKAGRGECWGRDDGEAAIVAWRSSGTSLRAFGRHHGVHVQRLAYWRNRLGSPSTNASFIPVTLTSAPADPVAARIVVGGAVIEVMDATRVSPDWIASVALSISGAR